MAEIKAEISTSTVDVKIKRVLSSIEINPSDNEVNVHYKNVEYYINGNGDEVVLGETPARYQADYAAWEVDPVGIAIKAAVETELAKAAPGSPA